MKIKIKSVFGKLLFELEKENNTLKETLREANLCGADLREANLCGANLREADLRGADLYGANLRRANLRGANLYGANLREADLRGADLYGADLYGANLYGANLPIYSKWNISVNDSGIIKIGCKTKNIADWDLWFSGNEVFDTSRDTYEFKIIQANYIAIREYYLFLNK